jgi:micrococcal nuclease
MRRRGWTTRLVVRVAALPIVFAAAGAVAAVPCAPEDGGSHGVARVIDGETLLLDDGREVRLIGALAPKADALSARDWPPAEEAARALAALVGGRTVLLSYEGRRRDRYGRVLAQVYVGPADGGVWVQERLIRDGYARAYALSGNVGCIGALMAAEGTARAARRGLWQRDTYRVRMADDVGTLARMAGRFALVEGRVADVTRAQRVTYLNFGADWRSDFTASLANAVVDRSDGAAERLSQLKGKTIRVRGWIERRNGPMIVLSSPDEIEVLDEASEALAR